MQKHTHKIRMLLFHKLFDKQETKRKRDRAFWFTPRCLLGLDQTKAQDPDTYLDGRQDPTI